MSQCSLQRLSMTLAFSLIVSSPWPSTHRHSVGPAFNCISSGRSNSVWHCWELRHLFMLLSAAVLTIATAHLLVLAVSCCTDWDTECHCLSCDWSQKACPHDISSMQFTLATDHLQDSSRHVHVSPWPGASLSGSILNTVITWCWSLSLAIRPVWAPGL